MRLLLAEDELSLAQPLKKELVQAGFAVDIAIEGIDAEYLGTESLYDIIILDLGLPNKNGLDILRHWRKNNIVTPVIILTARDTWHERLEGFKAGADDYLGKPFHTEELLARLNAILQRSKHNAPSNLVSNKTLTLDLNTQTVSNINNLSLQLTGVEFRLLRYFMLNPNKILSKTQLTEHVYNFDSDKDSNVIEVYVKRLRKLIGKQYIETRRGQGYIFKDNIKA